MVNVFEHYYISLRNQYYQTIEVKWIWAVIALISVIGCIGYAIYCTWSGGSFAGGIKIGIPDLIHVTFKCKR